MMCKPSTIWCLGASKKYFNNTYIASPQNPNIVLIPPLQNNKAQKHKLHFQLTQSNEIKEIQCIIGSILYYARAIDITVLMALSSIAIKQTKVTPNTMKKPNSSLTILLRSLTPPFDNKRRTWLWMPTQTPHTIWGESMQQSMRPFFHGLDCKSRWSYQTQRRIFWVMRHPPFCCCISRLSQTWLPLPQLQRGHDIPDDPQRIGPPCTKNTGPLW